MARAPAVCAISSIFPSTWSGTPDSIRAGGVPRRAGQNLRTRSWSAPMPPLVMTTACARSEKVPSRTRELGAPRSASSGARISPATPSIVPPLVSRSVTRCRWRTDTAPRAAAPRTRRTKSASTQGPVPQVMWKRGTASAISAVATRPASPAPTTMTSVSMRGSAALHHDAGLVPDATRRPHEDHLHAVASGTAEHDPRCVRERAERGELGVTAAVGTRSERGGQVVAEHLAQQTADGVPVEHEIFVRTLHRGLLCPARTETLGLDSLGPQARALE